MPGPDFAEEIAELTNERKQLVLERQQFADQLADQCVPRVNEWAKDVFLSQAKVAERMSANDIRALREEIRFRGARNRGAHPQPATGFALANACSAASARKSRVLVAIG